MRRCIRDAEADRDHVEKGGLGQRGATGAQIGPGVKAEFILPGGEIDAFQDGSVSAAVGIGVDGLERGGFALPEQFDLQARVRRPISLAFLASPRFRLWWP
jgi:hypothetical protein